MLGEHGGLIDDMLLAQALQRLRYYAALEDDRGGELDTLIEYLLPVGLQLIETVDAIYRFALAVGLRIDNSTSPEQITQAGLETLSQLGDFARKVLVAEREAVGKSTPAVRPLDVDLDPMEDIVEQVRRAGLFHREMAGIVVIPEAPSTSGKTAVSRELWKSVETVAGKRLPLDTAADLVTTRGALTRRYPHLLSEIDIVLRAPQPLRLLLVGEPGSGKTAFARSLTKALGLQVDDVLRRRRRRWRVRRHVVAMELGEDVSAAADDLPRSVVPIRSCSSTRSTRAIQAATTARSRTPYSRSSNRPVRGV